MKHQIDDEEFQLNPVILESKRLTRVRLPLHSSDKEKVSLYFGGGGLI